MPSRSSKTDAASQGLLDCLKLAQTIKDLQDFTLMCDGKSIPCSKFVLASQSDVFRAMFAQDGLAEARTNIAVIDDVTPEALEVFVNLLYSPRLNLSFDTAKYAQ